MEEFIVEPGRPTLNKTETRDLSRDVKTLNNALKFMGSKSKFVEILCSRTSRQRIEIAKAYKTCYDRDLLEDIKRKFRGDFRDLLVALLTPLKDFYCRELHEALQGAGTDEDALVQILVTMTNREIFEVSQKYLKSYDVSLENNLKSDTSGNFKKLLVSLANGTRDESHVLDFYSAKLDAAVLKRAGIDRWGTDCGTFNRIFCLRNFDQLKIIAQEYAAITGHPLERDIKKEFNGELEDGLLAILVYANNRPEFFARCLYKSMHGFGTNEKALTRIIVTRCEIDMLDIKEEFQRKYGKTLKSFIKGDTSGFYRKALLKLIGE